MIIGLGEDLVEISRIEKLIKNDATRFLNKCFTQDEIDKSSAHTSDSRKIAYFAKRFAAKEACKIRGWEFQVYTEQKIDKLQKVIKNQII